MGSNEVIYLNMNMVSISWQKEEGLASVFHNSTGKQKSMDTNAYQSNQA